MIAPLTHEDFSAPLTREQARETTRYLSDEAFEARWNTALAGGPVKLLRSFPGLWWRDLRALDPARVPQERAVGMGDAHPDNFGFLAFREHVRLAFNDLDDSGEVEIALDATRYFTALRLSGGAPHGPRLLRAWARALTERGEPVVDPGDAPKRKQLREAALARWSDLATLTPVAPDVAHAVTLALAAHPETAGLTIEAVRRRAVDRGGSGGLERFWVLVRDASGGDVIELKEQGPPGAEEGRGAVPLAGRLEALKRVLWRGMELSPYHTVAVDGRAFLARSRGQRADADAVDRIWHARILGAVHGAARLQHTPDALAGWVDGSARTLSERWLALHEAHKASARGL